MNICRSDFLCIIATGKPFLLSSRHRNDVEVDEIRVEHEKRKISDFSVVFGSEGAFFVLSRCRTDNQFGQKDLKHKKSICQTLLPSFAFKDAIIYVCLGLHYLWFLLHLQRGVWSRRSLIKKITIPLNSKYSFYLLFYSVMTPLIVESTGFTSPYTWFQEMRNWGMSSTLLTGKALVLQGSTTSTFQKPMQYGDALQVRKLKQISSSWAGKSHSWWCVD